MSTVSMLIVACGVLALLYGAYAIRSVLAAPAGTDRMQEIAAAIQEGASAYLNRQYTAIAIAGVVIAIILGWLLGLTVVIGFAIGAILSGLAGYIGMNVSVRANVRTAEAARSQGLAAGLSVAFKSGAITGMLVAGLALLGVVVYWLVLQEFEDISTKAGMRHVLEALVALGFGASLISIFARLGGGIFTKGADVGSDLVGKIEAGIPEDDPRNAGVIADNVGDNVGDCAGMAADLFETYAVTMVATMLLGALFFSGTDQAAMMTLPLLIGAVSIVGSVIATFFVRLGSSQSIMGALYKGFFASAIISGILIAVVINWQLGFATEFKVAGGEAISGMDLLISAVVGLVVTALIVWITEYYTGTNYRPVRSVAKASETGHATNIIQGIAISMEATALPVVVICAGIIVSYMTAGLYGLSIAATSMLARSSPVMKCEAIRSNLSGSSSSASGPDVGWAPMKR